MTHAKTDIINAQQAKVLDVLGHQSPMTMAQIMAAADMSSANLRRNMEGLDEAALVDVECHEHKNKAYQISISMRGRCALADYWRKQAEPAAGMALAATDNIFTRPHYVPQAMAYCRNTGHHHIASRGTRC